MLKDASESVADGIYDCGWEDLRDETTLFVGTFMVIESNFWLIKTFNLKM